MRDLAGQDAQGRVAAGNALDRRWLVVNPWARALLARIPQVWARPFAARLAAVVDTAEHPTKEGNKAAEDLLQAFQKKHGDALQWTGVAAGDVHDLARDFVALFGDAYCAVQQIYLQDADSGQPIDRRGLAALIELRCLDVMARLFDALGVDLPKAATASGAMKRSECVQWWRRAIRAKVARSLELGHIKMGLVNRGRGAYCSGDAVRARMKQLDAAKEFLSRALIKNEAGQVFRLATLQAASVSNPDIRRGELMARVRGCEEYAKEKNHIGIFATLTAPSRFHAQTIAGKRSVANPKYAGDSPKQAQAWLTKTWARARAELARAGIKIYGLRVVEPHHDGCPHWHALLFAEAQQAEQAQAIIKKQWLKDDGGEVGAAKYRCQFKRLSSNGAAAYVAKYISKSVGGSLDVGAHIDHDEQGRPMQVNRAGFTGAQRVDAWASLWGIRQFQFIGLPSVGLWRELRRVGQDQIDDMMGVTAERYAKKAWFACHKNEAADVQASYFHFIKQAGGAGIARRDCRFALAIGAQKQDGHLNQYGERVKQRRVLGVVLLSGYWLISRRMRWASVVGEAVTSPEENARLAAPWSGFNNCTARLRGKMRAALFPATESAKQARMAQEKLENRLHFYDHFEHLQNRKKIDANFAL